MAIKQEIEIIFSAKDKTGAALKSLSGGLGNVGKFGLKAAAVGIGAAVAGVGALAGGIGYLAKEAAQLGPIQESFDNIAKAAGTSGEVMIKALRDQSKGLISNTDLMKTYNLASQLVGDEFAGALPDAMGMLGKVAAATGEDMGFMMDSLVRGVGRMSPMILDNLGIQVDLTKANEDYAATLGKTAGELTKTEQQTALMNQVLEMLGENAANMPDMSDPFKQLSTTFVNLKDDVSKAIGPVVLPMIQGLADNISNFVASDEFQTWLKDTAEWLKVNLPIAIQILSDFWTNTLLPAIRTLWQWGTTVLIPFLKDVWKWLSTNIPPALEAVGIAFNTLKDGISTVVQKIIEVIGWLRAKWDEDFMGIRSLVEGALEHIKLVFKFFRAVFEGDWRKAGEVLREIVENIWETIKNVFSSQIRTISDKAKEIFASMVKTVKEMDWKELGISIIKGIIGGMISLNQWIRRQIEGIANGIVDFFKGFFGIDSPSKLFEDEIGKNIAFGINRGIMKGLSPSSTTIGARTSNINLNFGGAVYADPYELERMILPIVQKGIRADKMRYS